MKYFITLVAFVFCAFGTVSAEIMDGSVSYVHSPTLDRAEASAIFAVDLNTFAGIDFAASNERQHTFSSERDFKDPIYSVGLPINFDFDLLQINLRPFYYFKNKSYSDTFQDATAFGAKAKFVMVLQEDELEDVYTKAFIDIAFSRQKGTLFLEDAYSNQYYNQMAYSLGVSQELFHSFGFEIVGNAFQYPSGITGVTGFRGIMNQQDLAYTQTLNVVHDLAKYAVHAKFSRMWNESKSSLYVAYRFAEYFTTEPEHSVIIGNAFHVDFNVFANVAYNHVRNVHNENKTDIFSVSLMFAF